jgi:hypothetical protein
MHAIFFGAMKIHEIDLNSRADLERQISAFTKVNPQARLDETQINAHALGRPRWKTMEKV